MSLFNRDESSWGEMETSGEAFLIERARLARLTSYTELNATIVRRTGLPGFDFSRQDERAAMGHLLGLIVERNRPANGLMISALVSYLDANDAGPGFYALAQQLGYLPRGSSASVRFDFWINQVKSIHRHYASGHNQLPA